MTDDNVLKEQKFYPRARLGCFLQQGPRQVFLKLRVVEQRLEAGKELQKAKRTMNPKSLIQKNIMKISSSLPYSQSHQNSASAKLLSSTVTVVLLHHITPDGPCTRW